MNITNLFPRWFILFRLEEEVTKTPKYCKILFERKAIIVQYHFTCWPNFLKFASIILPMQQPFGIKGQGQRICEKRYD